MSKQRFLGGLLGANPFREGSFTDASTLDTYDFSNATVQLGSNGGASAYVGYNSVSISKDGNTAVASSQFADSSAGHVLVFEKSGGTWSQVADFDCPESASEVSFGHDTDISDDGTVIIVSDNANKKNSTTSTGIQQGNVYVYEKGAGWADGLASHTKTFLVTDNNHNGVNYLGDAITISGDGNTIAAGNRLGTSNRAYASSNLGSVYLWEKNGTWAATSSTPTILISTSQATNGKFGCDEVHALSLSEDGQTLAIRHKPRTTEGRLEIHEAGGGGWTAPSNSSATSTHHVSILNGTGSGNGHGNRVAISNDGLTIASEVVGNDTIIIHEKGAGWPSVGMTSQVATLSNSAATSIDFNGMSKDGNYVTAYNSSSYELLIWVKPATGWVDATETYRIAADATSTSTFAFGQWAAISDVGDLIISDARHASNAGRVEFHSGTGAVDTDRTTANVGILSLDEAGPEANGSRELTQMFWGGIRGRDVVESTAAVAGDANWNDVVLLLDGTSTTADVTGSTTITSSSVTAKPASGTGGAGLSGDAYGDPNGYVLDGSGTQITSTGGGSTYSFTNDFTLEAWVYLDTISTNNTLFRMGGSSFIGHMASFSPSSTATGTWILYLPNAADSGFGSTQNATLFTGLTTGAWKHIAVTKSGNTYRGYVNGVQTSGNIVDTTAGALSSDVLRVGLGGSYGWYGKMQDVRFTQGVARDIAADWTAGVYSSALPQGAPIAASDPSLANTGILSLSELLQASY